MYGRGGARRHWVSDQKITPSTGGRRPGPSIPPRRMCRGISHRIFDRLRTQQSCAQVNGSVWQRMAQTIVGSNIQNWLRGKRRGGHPDRRGRRRLLCRRRPGDSLGHRGSGEGGDSVFVHVDYTLTGQAKSSGCGRIPARTRSLDVAGNEFGQDIIGSLGRMSWTDRGGNDELRGVPVLTVTSFPPLSAPTISTSSTRSARSTSCCSTWVFPGLT